MNIKQFSGGYRTVRTDMGAGPGSRGGHIVGHTSGGKPIYEKHGHPSHKDFTEKEHQEAANIRLNKAVKLGGGHPRYVQHIEESLKHAKSFQKLNTQRMQKEMKERYKK